MIYYKMSLSLIIGWKNFYETGTVLETSVNKAFLQLDTDHVGKVNDLDNEVKDTKEEVDDVKDDVDDIKGDITNINNVLVNIQNAQVEVNNTVANNRHNPRFTGTMVMDGDMQIGGSLLQGWPVDTITTPFYSNNNEYTINGVNDVFTDSNIPVPTYSRSFELAFKNNSSANNNYDEKSFYSNTTEYNIGTSVNNGFRDDNLTIPNQNTNKTIELTFKTETSNFKTTGYALFTFGYQGSSFNTNYIFVQLHYTAACFNIWTGNSPQDLRTININVNNVFDGNWHHLMVHIDPSNLNIKLYLDNSQIGSETWSSINYLDHDTTGLTIGLLAPSNDRPFTNGYIKDFYIYDRLLSTQEMNNRYSIFQGNSPPSNNTNYGLLTSGFSSIGTNDANFNYFYFDMTNDNIVMYNGTNGSNGIGTISYDISSLFDNNYHHFIATISTVSRILTIYIDGQSVGTYTFASDNMIDCDSNGVRIGASIVDINNDIFKGSIKNIHIHNKYLSQEEVTIRYNLFNE